MDELMSKQERRSYWWRRVGAVVLLALGTQWVIASAESESTMLRALLTLAAAVAYGLAFDSHREATALYTMALLRKAARDA